MNTLLRLFRCHRGKHAWRVDPGETADGRHYGPWRVCRRCPDTTLLLDEPPLTHPESMTVKLPAAQEEWLAALDRELCPKEAV